MTVRVLIAGFKNPPSAVPAGIDLVVKRLCPNQLGTDCLMFRAVGYYLPVAITPADQSGATFSSSSMVILQTN